MRYLVDYVVEDREPDYGGEQAVQAVRCTLVVIRSAELGRPVRVDEIGELFRAY